MEEEFEMQESPAHDKKRIEAVSYHVQLESIALAKIGSR